MPIPDLDDRGVLPPGLHACSLEEIRERFGSFQRSEQRVRLHAALVRYAMEARSTRIIKALVVDGSFITSKPVDFFAQIKHQPGAIKGLLRVEL